MGAIHSHLQDQSAFEPEALRVMSEAFHDACNALHIFAGDEYGRQVVARRIVDLASTGVIDAEALRDRVLREARSTVA
jgi:hypothetical protein